MKNLLERSKDILNSLGLICSGVAITFLGIELKNSLIMIFGEISLLSFALFFFLSFILLIRDWILHPEKMV